MSLSVRPILSLFVTLSSLFLSSTALGWVESSVLADAITVEIEPSGQATVSHELTMRVRGGPLKGTDLAGVDFDAEPLEDAVVSPLGGGERESKPLLLTRGDDDTLRIEVGDDKGLRNGSYVFRFRYKTDLRQKSRIDTRGAWAQIDWIGPRYTAGLDVAKVTFRLPFAPTAPRLPEVEPSSDELSAGQLPNAALLSQLRRNGTMDELELLRPHVAKGEPVLWRIWAAPNAFPWLVAQKSVGDTPKVTGLSVSESPLRKGIPLILAGMVALALTVLVGFKARIVTAQAGLQSLRVLPLIPLSGNVRAGTTGLGVAMALLLAVRYELPTLAACVLLGASLFTVYRTPRFERVLRGPGRWLPIHEEEAWKKTKGVEFGRWLDASSPWGKGALTAIYIVLGAVVVRYFPRQPYYALLAVLGSLAILPSWLTGNFANTKAAEENRARATLERFSRYLTKRGRAKITVIGRFADGEGEPDEIRLRLSSKASQSSGVSLELAAHGGTVRGKPELSLIIRVREDSPEMVTYGKVLAFGRGRSPTERVAVVSFAVAAQTRLYRLIDELLQAPGTLHPPSPSVSTLFNRVAKSRAKGSSTSKPSKSPSPSHATRAA